MAPIPDYNCAPARLAYEELDVAAFAVWLRMLGLSCGLAAGQENFCSDGTFRNGDRPMTFCLTSSAFTIGQNIPSMYTADGLNQSPPLVWSGQPVGTVSLALICEDPDAPCGTWVHWVIFNIPTDAHELSENIPTDGSLANGARQGKNDFENIGYGGPSPPPGKPHRYFFRLFALDARLSLAVGATKDQLLTAMEGHILGTANMVGLYQRSIPAPAEG